VGPHGRALGLPLAAAGRPAAGRPAALSLDYLRGAGGDGGIAREAFGHPASRQFQAKLGADSDWQADMERLAGGARGGRPRAARLWRLELRRHLGSTRSASAGVAALTSCWNSPARRWRIAPGASAATGLPMKLDELAHDTASLLKAHRLGCMDAVALKLSKFGGLSALRRARDLCLHLGAKMCIEDTWGSDIATAAALHLGRPPRRDAAQRLRPVGLCRPAIAPDAPVRRRRPHRPAIGPRPGRRADLSGARRARPQLD
jgi:hypothetical protein